MPRVFLSIGTNQERERHLREAVRELQKSFDNVALSPVYETVAVGFVGEPFLNLVASMETMLSLPELLDRLREIETRCGRVRVEKRYGPRTMDIDVLTYGDFISEDESLEVPRSEMLRQAYVLRPLAELAPDVRHPDLGESYRSLYTRLALDETGMVPWPFEPCAPAQRVS